MVVLPEKLRCPSFATVKLRVEARTVPFSAAPQFRTILETEVNLNAIYTAMLEDKIKARRVLDKSSHKETAVARSTKDIHILMSWTEPDIWTRIVYRTVRLAW